MQSNTCTDQGGRGVQQVMMQDSIGVDVSSPHPPALPPRPPPRPRPLPQCSGRTSSPTGCCPHQQGDIVGSTGTSPPTPAHYEPAPDHISSHTYQQQHQHQSTTVPAAPSSTVAPHGNVRRRFWSAALRKYVILCTACGGMAALLGALFLLVHFVLRAHTSSLHYFETVPTYVPAAMLTVTGLVVMCFARRRNRYGYLIKVCGVCCLLCAVLCVVVTVTTTVIHMNRLQTLRECVYSPANQACTCYSGLVQEPSSSGSTDDGMRFVFHNTPDCEVVHGALYSCLRALFGLSVIGILVCIFSCMLVYQLLSHEKKKMYWEQLEMRCRYLYGRRNPQYAYCGCSCDECPRFPPSSAPAASTNTPHGELFPWPPWEQSGYLDDRYWSPPRIGNLYTPSPEEQNAAAISSQQTSAAGGNARWSWLPWNRGGTSTSTSGPTTCPNRVEQSQNVAQNVETERTYRGDPDSQYGFGATTRGVVQNPPRGAQIAPVCRPMVAQAFVTETSGGAGQLPRYLWGPPPPYSQPPSTASNSSTTSPIRTAPDPQPQPVSCYPRHHHPHHHVHHVHHVTTPAMHHHHHCEQPLSSHPGSPQHQAASPTPGIQSPNMTARRSVAGSPCCGRIRTEDVQGLKSLAELPSSGSGGNNTLPLRKPKKRPSESPVAVNAALAVIKANSGAQQQVVETVCGSDSPGRKSVGLASSLRGLFGTTPGSPSPHTAQRVIPQSAPTSANNSPHKSALPATNLSPLRRLPPTPSCMHVQSRPAEPTESEVYFADVSSCNGGPDSSLYDEPNAPEQRGDTESAQYASIPTPPPPGSRLRRPRYAERLAPDAQYEPRGHDVSGAPQPPQLAEDDAPMRDSDATIDSGVHSGSEVALQASNRMRPPPSLRVQDDQQILPPRSVNV